MNESDGANIIKLSGTKYLVICLALSIAIIGIGELIPIPRWAMALEVLAMILSLFVFGSIRYRLDKNALTFGAAIVISATFWTIWWPTSILRQSMPIGGMSGLWKFVRSHFLSFRGLDRMVHADTMLFILGLTLFVSVITQTRLLESVSFAILKTNRGRLAPTVALIAALVAAASGILDGVSMIGLMIRTIVVILFLAKTRDDTLIYIVMISTIVTTVCGMWLAYGEPPNLIMKANLYPHLDNAFFLRYCLPAALGSYFIVGWNIRRKLGKRKVIIEKLDFIESRVADVRFLQAMRHGKVLVNIEFLKEHEEPLGQYFQPLLKDIHQGMSIGEALVRAGVPQEIRRHLLGIYIAEEIAETLDGYYQSAIEREGQGSQPFIKRLDKYFEDIKERRLRTQRIGLLSFMPFIGFLIWHAANHNFPLFPASFAGFIVAFSGILFISRMRGLALAEARREFSEYLFLIPLFFCITLLQKTGFFEQMTQILHWGLRSVGASSLAAAQFAGATVLSAMLDNNVVADFAGRALQGIEVQFIHLFAMAQIAGYAVGGCWTHIGSAQSVLAYSFIRKEIKEHFTPYQWIKSMTPIIIEIAILMILIIYFEGWLFNHLQR